MCSGGSPRPNAHGGEPEGRPERRGVVAADRSVLAVDEPRPCACSVVFPVLDRLGTGGIGIPKARAVRLPSASRQASLRKHRVMSSADLLWVVVMGITFRIAMSQVISRSRGPILRPKPQVKLVARYCD